MKLQFQADEISSYSCIEPLARQKLGMRPASKAPTVIAPLSTEFLAFRRKSAK